MSGKMLLATQFGNSFPCKNLDNSMLYQSMNVVVAEVGRSDPGQAKQGEMMHFCKSDVLTLCKAPSTSLLC